MLAQIDSYRAGAAVNATGTEGLIYVRGATAGGLPVAALGTAGNRLTAIGVCHKVGYGALGQELAIVTAGPCQVKLGTGWTPGTTRGAFMSDADGRAIPCTDDDAQVGYLRLNSGGSYAINTIHDAIISVANQGA